MNILTDKQKQELEIMIKNYNYPDTKDIFWSQFENWIFEFLKNYLSTVFRNSMGNSLKEMQVSISNSDTKEKEKVEIIIH